MYGQVTNMIMPDIQHDHVGHSTEVSEQHIMSPNIKCVSKE